MHIVFLKFGANRALASQWIADHVEWIQRGIDDGVFLLAGSLENAQGGVLLSKGLDKEALQARVNEDPFVQHGVVVAELHAVTPSRVEPRMAELLG